MGGAETETIGNPNQGGIVMGLDNGTGMNLDIGIGWFWLLTWGAGHQSVGTDPNQGD